MSEYSAKYTIRESDTPLVLANAHLRIAALDGLARAIQQNASAFVLRLRQLRELQKNRDAPVPPSPLLAWFSVTVRSTARRREYTANERKLLLDGVSMPTDWGHIHRGRFDYAAAKAAWRELESELLPVWIAEHPFTRPWAWLVFDAEEPRIRTVGEQRIESMEEVKARGWLRGSYLLCYFQDLNKRLGAEETRYHEGEWETEKQYLARIGALTAEELALL